MRRGLTRERLRALMRQIARSAPGGRTFRVFILGGGTAVYAGWRDSTIDADLYSDQDDVFREIQAIKEKLQLNVELVRPEDFVPPLEDSDTRHVAIETIGNVGFYHYDPYAQLLSKIVRGFRKDLLDAESLIDSGMVDVDRFRALVHAIPAAAYARYPQLSPAAVREAVDDFLLGIRPG